MFKMRMYLVRQILQHRGWVDVSDTKVKELAMRFSVDELNVILRYVEIPDRRVA